MMSLVLNGNLKQITSLKLAKTGCFFWKITLGSCVLQSFSDALEIVRVTVFMPMLSRLIRSCRKTVMRSLIQWLILPGPREVVGKRGSIWSGVPPKKRRVLLFKAHVTPNYRCIMNRSSFTPSLFMTLNGRG